MVNPMEVNRYSGSEIEALAVKAARGAGYDWGMAEEAGMAASWLAREGLPGPALLLACLEGPRGGAPVIGAAGWAAASGTRLCPLAAGAALSDRAALADGPGAVCVTLRDLGHPALTLPFAAQVAVRLGQTLRLDWQGTEVTLTPDGRLVTFSAEGLLADQTPSLSVALASPCEGPVLIDAGHIVPLTVWKKLERLALATTVPATSSSRAGAGSASSDND